MKRKQDGLGNNFEVAEDNLRELRGVGMQLL